MRQVGALFILCLLLVAGRAPAHASPSVSDWPSLNADGGQSNSNTSETTLSASNVAKLKVRWAATLSDASYPIVAQGRVYLPILTHGKIHVRVLNANTGKPVAVFPKDASGGMLYADGSFYLAGHIVQQLDPSNGSKLAQVPAPAATKGGLFLNPITDHKLLVVGFFNGKTGTQASLVGISPDSNQVVWTVPSQSALAAIGGGRILTHTGIGSDFYDETNGKRVARVANVHSDWFTGRRLAYTVATVKRGKATLFAFDSSGHTVWKRVVGPYINTSPWPHALNGKGVYVQTLRPTEGIQALDPQTGRVLWSKAVPGVTKLALVNGMLLALTYRLGLPVKVLAFKAASGAAIGGVVLSPGYYAFTSANGLMVADGKVFVRVVGPPGSQLIALGL